MECVIDDNMYQNNPNMIQWHTSASQMIPRALQSQNQPNFPANKNKKMVSMKGSMSTEFNHNFGSRLIGESEDRFG